MDRQDAARSFAHRETNYELLESVYDVYGTMGRVTVARNIIRIPLVARRHIDLKRVCSCRCLP